MARRMWWGLVAGGAWLGAGCTLLLNTETVVTTCEVDRDCHRALDEGFVCDLGACLPGTRADAGPGPRPDAGPVPDAGRPDAAVDPPDAAVDAPDAAALDAGPAPDAATPPPDAGQPDGGDAGPQTPDAGPGDAGQATDGGAPDV